MGVFVCDHKGCGAWKRLGYSPAAALDMGLVRTPLFDSWQKYFNAT